MSLAGAAPALPHNPHLALCGSAAPSVYLCTRVVCLLSTKESFGSPEPGAPAGRAAVPGGAQCCGQAAVCPVQHSSPPPGDGATCSEQSRAAWRPGSHLGAKEGGGAARWAQPSADLRAGIAQLCDRPFVRHRCSAGDGARGVELSGGSARGRSHGCAAGALSAAASKSAALIPCLGLCVGNCSLGGCAERRGSPAC